MELDNLKFWTNKLENAKQIMEWADYGSDLYNKAEDQAQNAETEIEILKNL